MTEREQKGADRQQQGADQQGLEGHEKLRRTGRVEPPGAGTAAGVDYQDERGSLRYVGGGSQGGQNWANEGYGANQSYSAGEGYAAAAPATEQGASEEGQQADYAVSPEDLGVEKDDLQGGYGRPPAGKP
jgi:hypothetical protein